MNDYLMFMENSVAKKYQFRCRETLIHRYQEKAAYISNKDQGINYVYFGHNVNLKRVTNKYIPICKDIWGDRIEYKLTTVGEIEYIPTIKSLLFQLMNYRLPLLKIKGIVNPCDISLILYLSWYGTTNSLKKYVLTKRYTGNDIIPDLYKDMSEYGYDGPESYIYSLYGEEYKQIEDISEEHHNDIICY